MDGVSALTGHINNISITGVHFVLDDLPDHLLKGRHGYFSIVVDSLPEKIFFTVKWVKQRDIGLDFDDLGEGHSIADSLIRIMTGMDEKVYDGVETTKKHVGIWVYVYALLAVLSMGLMVVFTLHYLVD